MQKVVYIRTGLTCRFSPSKELLYVLREVIRGYGVPSSISIATRNREKSIYALSIYSKRNLELFFRIFGVSHPEKRERLINLLRSP